MKECPLIDTCVLRVTEDYFKRFCRVDWRMCEPLSAKRPREWKKEKEES